jgi:integrase
MASIHPRTSRTGATTFQVRWREAGRQTSREAPTLPAARRLKALVEAHGTYADGMAIAGVPTVAEQAEEYLQHHTRGNDDTRRDYRRIFDQHIAPTFADLAVSAVTPQLLTAWGAGLVMADKTRANVTAVMSGILESAVPEWLPANPWRKVRLQKRDGPRETHFLTSADFALILAEIPEGFRLLVTTLATTGLRWGELAALDVRDLDLRGPAPVLKVTKAVKHRDKQGDEPGIPKTRKAVRHVTAPAELADVFRAAVNGRRIYDPLFTNTVGRRVRRSTFHGSVWSPALDRAQGKGLAFRPRIHDLRAAATTWLIEAGMRPDEVADLMGHESIDTTLRIYRRMNPESGRRAAAAMSRVLEQAVARELEG